MNKLINIISDILLAIGLITMIIFSYLDNESMVIISLFSMIVVYALLVLPVRFMEELEK